MDSGDFADEFGGPKTPIKVNEISGLVQYLQSIDWTEPWFCGLAIFHVTCAILTVVTRRTGALQSIYFGALVLLVFSAEFINEWAAQHWSKFARQQYFDSNGLFISVVFSVPLLINCLVIVISWLFDVGLLISNVKQLKIRQQTRIAQRNQSNSNNQNVTEQSLDGSDGEEVETKKDK